LPVISDARVGAQTVLAETHAFRSQPVNIGGGDPLFATTAQVPAPQIVRQIEDDIVRL